MNQTALRKALTSMTRALAKKGDYQSIFEALKSASPEVAAKHLEVCSADEALAGAVLVLGYDDSNDYACIDHYLTGNASVLLKRMQYLVPRMDAVSAHLRRWEGTSA